MEKDKQSKITVQLTENSAFSVTYAPDKFSKEDRQKADKTIADTSPKAANPFREPSYDAALPETPSQIRANIAYVSTHAPGKFPLRDYLGPDEQPKLEGEFWIIHNSLNLICSKQKFQGLRPELESLLLESFMAYKSGDRKSGLALLYKFEDMIFGPPA